MASRPVSYMPADTYLALERRAETKSEWIDGETVAMVGASREHNLIVANILGELRQQLKGRPCEVYPSDMRVKVPQSKLYTYPDVVVVCGEPQFEDAHVDTLLNPTLLVEVLSDSTESYDRGKKFGYYRTLPSLAEYLLIAQDDYKIEHYVRQPDGKWLLSDAQSLDDTVTLAAVPATLSLREVYDRVTFA
ncbi:MAG: Uma2 family endonuclease [Ardenticatenales bacterium]|nr:Uma2 family endonuclease [Ardenticatenales bacterium]